MTQKAPLDPKTEMGRRSYRIVVGAGPDVGRELIVVPPSRVLIGTSATCDLVLTDRQVSRRHLSLDLVTPELQAADLTSTNGTYVNGVRIGSATLTGGEVITLGSTRLEVGHGAAEPNKLGVAVSFGKLVGASAAMRRLYPRCERLAQSDISVIIEGETGVGKEVLAEALHEMGPRKDRPFVVVDCAAIASNAGEELLFGDADGTRGVFEQARGGTLLIDEIGELALSLQSRLLPAMDRKEADVRIIATSRRDLDREVEAGRFREDLFFRLAVGRIELPPLRQRERDVRILAEHFWRKHGGGDRPMPADFLHRYESYAWPGNVRELLNVVVRRLALGDADPDEDHEAPEPPQAAPEHAFQWVLEQHLPFSAARDTVISEFRNAFVERVLVEHNGNVSRAAAASGLARRYFQILRARQKKSG
jgi:two-component system, NtrC family, response regulator HydG